MKKIVSSILFLFAIAINAQANFSLANNGQFLPQDNAIFNKVNSPSAGKNLSYSDIQGSPYYSKGYIVAKFSGSNESAPAKYNSYNDEVEFMKEDKPYVLPKNENFSTVTFTTTKETLVRLETNDELSGYFFELVNGKNILYKKVKTKFIDAVVAVNSYATDRPAVFKALDPIYYIKTENGFIKNPKNKKEIIDQFADKKEVLNTFFKENKIKFDKEEDLKKLVTFLNQ
ncbi:hypothetical protein [Chryseobacterium scophthalmum]|uniref:GLPGLI family protein n=1 Tax=Chryseobacterium scophthalmum TaxID=59733 RepID=A0A1N6HXD0_9FLAO|nr:hypothetical protein [Chryseobacterium scophthalmum]SIO24275.1 hypothetical protein SAMN05421769_2949 [Chryseobacterium scophthalmum]